MVPEGWEVKNFLDLIIKANTYKKCQLLKSKYKKEGKHPVIDQGNKFIVSYSDETKLLQSDLPVIIFGDHTRIFKYIDFKFIIGADGVKIIKAKDDKIFSKFLYYALCNIKLKNLGYSRHYKLLKEINIIYPIKIHEQKKIAEILSSVDESIQATRKVIDRAKLVKKGLLQELLTRGIGHTRFKRVQLGTESVEIPVEWEVKRLGELLKIIRRPCRMQDNKEYNLITIRRRHEGIVSRGKLLGKKILVKSQFYIKEGDFVISKRQIVHGACEIVPKSLSGSIVSNEYFVLSASPDLELSYLNWLSRTELMMKYFLISSIGVHIEKMFFKIEDWLKLKILLPPLPEQKHIATILSSVDTTIHTNEKKLMQLRQLKKGLMQDLLTGKVRVKV